MKYYVPNVCGDKDNPIEFYSKYDGEFAAEIAAKHFHDQCDGWESIWPLTFVLVYDDGREESFIVERDWEPVFMQKKKKLQGDRE